MSLCLDKVDDLLNESLHRGKALLLFDGLDEVPLEATAGTSVDRQTTLEAIRLFTEMHDRVSAVVTCRKRAFDDSLNQQLGWQVETIAPFTLGQVRHFVPAWYNELARQGQIDHQRAEQLTKTLIDTIVGSERLREMAKTPLLLTMMALVLYNRGELPRDRPQLYERILELLLGQWDKVRDGQSLAEAIGLPEWGSERLRPLLDRLSYDAHLRGSSEDGRGRLKRGELYTGLIDFFKTARVPNYADAALRCLDYFEQRSGLLLPDESDSYAFAHLTLQEHCAGRHMMHDREAATLVMQHRGDDRWREPIMLGLGVVQQTKPELIDRVLADLIDADESGKPKEAARRQRDLVFAAEIGKDRDWNYLRTQHVNVDRLQRDLRRGLVELLEDKSQPLPTVERVRAAELLGELGDPRFPVTLDQWRAELGKRNERFGEPNGYWCYVKPGTYRIGGWEEVEPHADIELPGFWIARFPITVAQFAPFVEVGYENEAERWWTPEGWSWLQETDRTYPKALDYHQYNKFNQPIVSLTWYEALTYAKWLDAQLSNLLPDGFMIRLPNEAEWETAAAYDNNFIRNVYPWGDDEPTTERAIYKASNLDRPAPVGCCPSGLAKCGALDLAGNVLEWIVGEWYKYPTASDQGVRDFTPNDYEVPLRGGEFNSNSSYIRCGERERLNPLNARFSSGFRLVLAPRLPQ